MVRLIDAMGLLAMELEANATPETRSKIPLVQRYFELEDKNERTEAENKEMKELEAEINDIGLN